MRAKILDIDGNILNILPEGHHVIGRSTVLNCNDKRVSRTHAAITIDQNEAVLTAIHINPCYYKAATSNNTIILKEHNELQLQNNDKFGFLPDKYWYQIELIIDQNTDTKNTNGTLTTTATTSCTDIITNQSRNDDGKRYSDDDTTNDKNLTKKIKLEFDQRETTMDESFTFIVNEAIIEKTEESPTKLDNPTLNISIKSDEIDQLQITKNDDEIVDGRSEDPTLPSASNLVNHTNHPNDNNQPSTSNDDGKPKKKRRERCWYGAGCYRKNPVHRLDLSHPNDSDYASDPDDDRPVCTYGATCYRRNKIHRQDYKHPSSPSPRKLVKRKKAKTNGTGTPKNSNDTPDDDYDFDDPFIDDGESDEYVEGSSDVDDDTDGEDSSNIQEASEDLARLLKEAKRFTRNPK